MATIKICDVCGEKFQAGGADVRKITMPETMEAGARQVDFDLCRKDMRKVRLALGLPVIDDEPAKAAS